MTVPSGLLRHCLAIAFATATASADAGTFKAPLTVVQDFGGDSALPYYRALNLEPRPSDVSQPGAALPMPPIPIHRYREADFLPVRSARLTPGPVIRRVIAAPGLSPIFLVGDDPLSRSWLRERLATLHRLHAIGLVVSVSTSEALASLRRLAPALQLVPASGDDLALRLKIAHYPVLITATGIEQ